MQGRVDMWVERTTENGVDAIATGALDGLKLALNVGARIIAANPTPTDCLSDGRPLGRLRDCAEVGMLLGKKTILNEFIAYLDLQTLIEENAVSERATIIATYALCGFTNIGSIGIQIDGIAPNRRADLTRISIRAMIAGTMTACIAGILL